MWIELLPPAIQLFMDQIPSAMGCLCNQDFDLDQLHLRRFLCNIPKEFQGVGYVMEPEQLALVIGIDAVLGGFAR